jgi:2-hydroxychromene-2-carboxylate isomerase
MIDFWFTMGSTYTCLAVMRLPEVERKTGISFRWRPFNLLSIFSQMNHIPFADKPRKEAYMWRDMERRAALHGLRVRVPAPYPVKDSAIANKVAILGLEEGWGEAFVRAAYRRWFQEGLENGGEANLVQSLEEAGQDPASVLTQARLAHASRVFEEETAVADRLGICGAPTFVADGEVFWGDDRLEEAVAWAKGEHPARRG